MTADLVLFCFCPETANFQILHRGFFKGNREMLGVRKVKTKVYFNVEMSDSNGQYLI